MQQINKESIKLFHSLLLDRFTNLGLVRTELDGYEVDVVAAFEEDVEGGYTVQPLLLVVSKQLFERLKRPDLFGIGCQGV